MFKYGVISGPYFPEFSPNTGKYVSEITPYLDTFHAVINISKLIGRMSASKKVKRKNLRIKIFEFTPEHSADDKSFMLTGTNTD